MSELQHLDVSVNAITLVGESNPHCMGGGQRALVPPARMCMASTCMNACCGKRPCSPGATRTLSCAHVPPCQRECPTLSEGSSKQPQTAQHASFEQPSSEQRKPSHAHHHLIRSSLAWASWSASSCSTCRATSWERATACLKTWHPCTPWWCCRWVEAREGNLCWVVPRVGTAQAGLPEDLAFLHSLVVLQVG